jgi:hypothetical protein
MLSDSHHFRFIIVASKSKKSKKLLPASRNLGISLINFKYHPGSALNVQRSTVTSANVPWDLEHSNLIQMIRFMAVSCFQSAFCHSTSRYEQVISTNYI